MATAKPKAAPVSEAQADLPEGVGAIQMTGDEARKRQSNIDLWRDRFAAMPKVRVRLAEDTFVQVNGYSFQIKGKVPVDVPELVAEILGQAGEY